MKLFSPLLAVLLGYLSLDAQAAELSIGADAMPIVAWKKCNFAIFCGMTDYDGDSYGSGIHAGFWLPQDGGAKYGAEIGYDKISATTGSKQYKLDPRCVILCAGATADWKNSASIAYAWFGASSSELIGHGAATVKIGLYSSSVRTDANNGTPGGAYTRTVSGIGPLIGAGYSYHLTPHLAARVAIDIFFDVKVSSPITMGNTLSETLITLGVGGEYTF